MKVGIKNFNADAFAADHLDFLRSERQSADFFYNTITSGIKPQSLAVTNNRNATGTGMSSKHKETRSPVNESISVNFDQKKTQIFESQQEKEVRSGITSPQTNNQSMKRLSMTMEGKESVLSRPNPTKSNRASQNGIDLGQHAISVITPRIPYIHSSNKDHQIKWETTTREGVSNFHLGTQQTISPIIKQGQAILQLQGMMRRSQQTARETNKNVIQPQANHFITAVDTEQCTQLNSAINYISQQKKIVGKYKQYRFNEFQKLKHYSQIEQIQITQHSNQRNQASKTKNPFNQESLNHKSTFDAKKMSNLTMDSKRTGQSLTQLSSDEEGFDQSSDSDDSKIEELDSDVKNRVENFTLQKVLSKKHNNLDDYLIGGKEMRQTGVSLYMKKLQAKVEAKPPAINISLITRSFYNPTVDGQPIANVFRLNYVKNELQKGRESLDKKKQIIQDSPDRSAQKQFKSQDSIPFGERFDLDRYSLKQIDSAFKVYQDTLNMIKQGEAMLQNAGSKWAKDTAKIDLQDIIIIEKLRKDNNPELRQIATQLQNPFFLALVKLIRLYIKFNQEHEAETLNKLQKEDKELARHQNEISQIKKQIKNVKYDLEITLNDTSTIILMKQLLKEFGLGLKKFIEQHKLDEKAGESQIRMHRRTPSLFEGESFDKIAQMAKTNLLYKLKESQDRVQEEENFFGEIPNLIQRSSLPPQQKRLINPSKLQKISSFMQSKQFTSIFDQILAQINSQKQKIQVSMNLMYIYKQDFFKICRQYIVGGSIIDPNVGFLQNCNRKNVSACPIFVKIQNHVLNLISYTLNEGHALATANYISEKKLDPAMNVHTLIMHNNHCNDTSFSAILEALYAQNQLKHITYSCNQLKTKSIAVLDKIFDRPGPYNLQSLVLCGIEISQEHTTILFDSLSRCDHLIKLVLKDIPIQTNSCGAALAKCVKEIYKLENLQIINCGLSARTLLLVCRELEPNQQLQNLSLARNVMQKHPTNQFVIDSLTTMVQNSKVLTHLDLSGMYLGDVYVKKIVTEAVAPSLSIAAFHFDGNKVSEEARRKIYQIFRHPPKRDAHSNLVFEEGQTSETEDEIMTIQTQPSIVLGQGDIKLNQEQGALKQDIYDLRIHTDISSLTDNQKSQKINHSSPSISEVKTKPKHKKMGTDKQDLDQVFTNIIGLQAIHSQLVEGPIAQSIVDAEQLAQRTVAENENPIFSFAQMRVGTIYTRVTRLPELFGNKDKVNELFKQSPWMSVSAVEGCWICKSAQIRLKELKKHNTATGRKSLHRLFE